jgi:hypothetical protein
MHLCNDELMALAGLAPGLAYAWHWLKYRLTRRRLRQAPITLYSTEVK